MRKKIINIFIFIVVFLLFCKQVIAQNLVVNCNASAVCSRSPNTALFPTNIIWYPGLSLSRTIRVTNNTGAIITVNNSGEKTTTSSLNQVLNLLIKKTSDNATIWSGSLEDFYNTDYINLAFLPNNNFQDFVYTISMNSSASNNYQNKNTSFDLHFNFTSEFITPTITPTPILLGTVVANNDTKTPTTKAESTSSSKYTLTQDFLIQPFVFSQSSYGFSPTLLGLATPSSNLELAAIGEIQGIKTQNNSSFWFKTIGAELLLILIYLLIKFRKRLLRIIERFKRI